MYIPIYRRLRLRENRTAEKYKKTKNQVSNIFGLSIFFVEEPPLYLLQGNHKLALIIMYIYITVRDCVSTKRLRISKNAEIGVQYFWIIYLFCNRHSALYPTGWPQNVIQNTLKKNKK